MNIIDKNDVGGSVVIERAFGDGRFMHKTMFRIFALLSLVSTGAFVKAEELVYNQSFEQVNAQGMPEGWMPMAFSNPKADAGKSCSLVEVTDAPGGSKAVRLNPDISQISLFVQLVKDLKPGQWYEASAYIKCQNLKGHGASLMVEFWKGTNPYGNVDTNHMYGTMDWKKQTVRFLAPPSDYTVKLTCIQIGGPGSAWFQKPTIVPIPAPKQDVSKRKVVDVPFFGIYTHVPSHVHKFVEDMAKVGVGLTRQGENTLDEDHSQIELMRKVGMKNVICAVRAPLVSDKNDLSDPTYPFDSSKWEKQLNYEIPRLNPITSVYEMFNESNMRVSDDWRHNLSLPSYIKMCEIAGRVIKEKKPDLLLGTGGFANPMVGYTEALLEGLDKKYIDIILLHPYATDEPLDSLLNAIGDVSKRTGREDIAVAISETGFPTWDPETPNKDFTWYVSEKEQAACITKLHIQSLAYKLSFVAYLGWNDFTEPSDACQNMGLVRVDGSKKPSYYSYKFMIETVGKRAVEEWTYDDDATRCYRLAGERPVWVLWNGIRDVETTLDVGSQNVLVYDMFGAKTSVLPESGKIKVKVGSDPVYVIPERS